MAKKSTSTDPIAEAAVFAEPSSMDDAWDEPETAASGPAAVVAPQSPDYVEEPLPVPVPPVDLAKTYVVAGTAKVTVSGGGIALYKFSPGDIVSDEVFGKGFVDRMVQAGIPLVEKV